MFAINNAAIAIIKHYESLHDGDLKAIGLNPKMCPAGIWTVGYGHALRNNSGGFLKGWKDKAEAYRQYGYLEESGAENLLQQDVKLFAHQVESLIKVPVTDNQFGAMVSLAYNIGTNAFKTSSVLRLLTAGDVAGAADAFRLWNKGTSPVTGKRKVLNGLVKRRESERELFLS